MCVPDWGCYLKATKHGDLRVNIPRLPTDFYVLDRRGLSKDMLSN